jgi:hypothetical protein
MQGYDERKNSEAVRRLTVKYLATMPDGDKEFFYHYRSEAEAAKVASTISRELSIEVERVGSVLRMAQIVQKEISLKTFAPAPVVATPVSTATFSRDYLEK